MKRRDGGAAPRKTPFPGGAGAGRRLPLRLAIDRKPMAELLAHGAESPENEVCGVLVGYVGEDEAGTFVHATAAIRGEKAREQNSHVTFTHDTWNHIHREMDSRHTGLQIIGWYHTHPGFGVFLSDMDTFIHKNFFSEPHQVALVYDPLAGKTGIFCVRDGALAPLPAYWRDGRSVDLDVSPRAAAGGADDGGALAAEVCDLRAAVERLDQMMRGGARRSRLEEWLIPGLLMLVALMLVAQTYMLPRATAELILMALERVLYMESSIDPYRGPGAAAPPRPRAAEPERR